MRSLWRPDALIARTAEDGSMFTTQRQSVHVPGWGRGRPPAGLFLLETLLPRPFAQSSSRRPFAELPPPRLPCRPLGVAVGHSTICHCTRLHATHLPSMSFCRAPEFIARACWHTCSSQFVICTLHTVSYFPVCARARVCRVSAGYNSSCLIR